MTLALAFAAVTDSGNGQKNSGGGATRSGKRRLLAVGRGGVRGPTARARRKVLQVVRDTGGL